MHLTWRLTSCRQIGALLVNFVRSRIFAFCTCSVHGVPMASSAKRESSHRQVSIDPAEWVDRHGDVLYRYAIVRVRKQEIAEDLVQETLLAALKSQDKFEGQSAEQVWLIGILRHKILDYLRSRSRGVDGRTEAGSTDWLADFFDDRGNWRKPPDPTAVNPDSLVEREEFWDVFDHCLEGLPPRAREAFTRRVIEQEDTKSISEALSVTANNLWVILFRARTQMRSCLMLKWFGEQGGTPRNEAGHRDTSDRRPS